MAWKNLIIDVCVSLVINFYSIFSQITSPGATLSNHVAMDLIARSELYLRIPWALIYGDSGTCGWAFKPWPDPFPEALYGLAGRRGYGRGLVLMWGIAWSVFGLCSQMKFPINSSQNDNKSLLSAIGQSRISYSPTAAVSYWCHVEPTSSTFICLCLCGCPSLYLPVCLLEFLTCLCISMCSPTVTIASASLYLFICHLSVCLFVFLMVGVLPSRFATQWQQFLPRTGKEV